MHCIGWDFVRIREKLVEICQNPMSFRTNLNLSHPIGSWKTGFGGWDLSNFDDKKDKSQLTGFALVEILSESLRNCWDLSKSNVSKDKSQQTSSTGWDLSILGWDLSAHGKKNNGSRAKNRFEGDFHRTTLLTSRSNRFLQCTLQMLANILRIKCGPFFFFSIKVFLNF